jgi:DNA (cytosine-5)-methyltransferase 1
MTLTAIDIFSGIGGWNVACTSLGIHVVMAANHSQPSLATNKLNFPHTKQVNLDIMTCDPETIPDADILTASPECTNQSNSKGIELLHQNQLRLWTDRSEDPFVKQSRETMNGVHRWAEIKHDQGKPFKLIFLENVTDLKHWGGLKNWREKMERLGYQHHDHLIQQHVCASGTISCAPEQRPLLHHSLAGRSACTEHGYSPGCILPSLLLRGASHPVLAEWKQAIWRLWRAI